MAPELRPRKPAASAAAAAPKPTPKPKTAAPSKRKAAEDASPVAPKKTKASKADTAAKKSTKSAKSAKSPKPAAKEEKPAEPEEPAEPAKPDEPAEPAEPIEPAEPMVQDDEAPVSEEENDQALALAGVSDNEDDGGAPVDESVAYKKGQDVGKAPKASKAVEEAAKAGKGGNDDTGVVYIGRIPHGFYEHEMRSYFSQFGDITRLRLSRNKKTGASKHFAFVEFAEESTAEIVAKTMNNYMLFGHLLKCRVVPKAQVHESLFKGANKRFKAIPQNKIQGNKLKKPLSEDQWAAKISKEHQKRAKKADKLKDLGYEFEAPTLKTAIASQGTASLEDSQEEAPKAIEAAPAAKETKAGKKEKTAVEESSEEAATPKAEAATPKAKAEKPAKESKKAAPTPKKAASKAAATPKKAAATPRKAAATPRKAAATPKPAAAKATPRTRKAKA